jgi:hypothetical protein
LDDVARLKTKCLVVDAVFTQIDLQSVNRIVEASARLIIFHAGFSIDSLAVANFQIVPLDIPSGIPGGSDETQTGQK